MTEQNAAPRAWARIAGIFYAVTFTCGVFAQYGVRSALAVRDDAAATAQNILANEQLYRLALAADIAGIAAYACVTAILYGLLKPVHARLALLATCASIAGIAVGMGSVIFHIAPLFLLSGKPILASFSEAQLQSLSALSLQLHGQIYTVAMTFFGVYCLVIGSLIARSGFLPAVIGIVLALGGVGYLIDCFTTMIDPDFSWKIYPYTYIPGIAGECMLALWLLGVGLNEPKWRAREEASRA